MVKFLCYVLRFVVDAGARMIVQESSGEVSYKDEDDDGDDTSSGEDYKDHIAGSNNNQPANHQVSSRKEKDLMEDARVLFRWTSRQKEFVEALWETVIDMGGDPTQLGATHGDPWGPWD
jgi:hypothetical protein